VAPRPEVLPDLHLHWRPGEDSDTLLEEVGIVRHPRLVQQFGKPYLSSSAVVFGPSYSVDWSLPIGTARWPFSSTADALTHFSGLYPLLLLRGQFW
jgi:hypothetical protein